MTRAENPRERVDLERRADAPVLGGLLSHIEEPGVDLLALVAARVERVAERRAGLAAQIADQPQLERMHPREVAAIGER